MADGLRIRAVLPAVAVLALGVAAWTAPPYLSGRDGLRPPGWGHWLGTNDLGQDVLAGLLVAVPASVLIALAASLLALSLATALSLSAVLGGRIVSAILLRAVDMMQAVPSVLVLLLVAAWTRPGVAGLVAVLAATSWHDDVRVLRAVLLRELTRENVQVARRMGAGWGYCAVRHILPAVRPTLAGLYVQHIRQAALKTAGLGFLGLADPRRPTLGGMMQEALDHLHDGAWLWLLPPPALCLSALLLAALAAERGLRRRAIPMEGA